MRLKYLLLPIAGAISALISFVAAAPYVKTLNRPNLSNDDPASHFTYGTQWTNVQHVVFGAMLCGSFALILEMGRRTPGRVIRAAIFGAVLGAFLNTFADSGSDLIGITLARKSGTTGEIAGAVCWLFLVPLALSLSVMIAIGPTAQRIRRAIYATFVAAFFCFIAKIFGLMVSAGMMLSKGVPSLATITNQTSAMEAAVPGWMIEAAAVGVALGLTMLIADRRSRSGSVRLLFGRNEYRDWSLDYQANRIGSGEVEIPIRGFKDVQPVHSCIFRQGRDFIFDSAHAPALLNGHPVQQALLNHGDTMQIGEATLVFYGSGPVRGSYRPAYQPPRAQEPFPPEMMPGQPNPQVFPPQPVMPAPMQPMPGHAPVAAPVQPMPVPDPIPVAAPTPTFFLVDIGGREIQIQPGVNTVGRELGNMIQIPSNTTVSRNHAVINLNGSELTVIDQGSANGTRVNKTAVSSPVVLQPGDEVSFGSALYTIRMQNYEIVIKITPSSCISGNMLL